MATQLLIKIGKPKISFEKHGNTAVDQNWKAQNNCSLLYATNSQPTAAVPIVHAWMLNTELETGWKSTKDNLSNLNSK